MAVSRISDTHAYDYVGTTADTKPTAGVPAGSRFWEYDAGTGEVARYVYTGAAWGLDTTGGDATVNTALLVPQTATGDAVLDESKADWTGYTDLITITPAASNPLTRCYLDLDLAKASTGFAAGYTSQTLTAQVVRKVDGTNYRAEAAQTAISGTNAAGRLLRLDLGTVSEAECVKVQVKLSAENGGSVVAHFPFVLHYVAVTAPTVAAAT